MAGDRQTPKGKHVYEFIDVTRLRDSLPMTVTRMAFNTNVFRLGHGSQTPGTYDEGYQAGLGNCPEAECNEQECSEHYENGYQSGWQDGYDEGFRSGGGGEGQH